MTSTRWFMVPIGLACACVIGLVGCGTASSSTPGPTTAATQAAASGSAAPSRASASGTGASATALTGATCIPTPLKFDAKAPIDLTGAWAGDDGGIYYVRQRDKVIWWNGMSSRDGSPENLGTDWNNVGRGEIQSDLSITADWVDVPRGGVGGYGTVDFLIGPDASGNIQITKIGETGTGRGDTVWTRCTPGFPG